MAKARENSSLAGEAYVIVRERILRGELLIGQSISRRKLAAELGMTLLPVSEALKRLEDEGHLESRPRAGTRVRLPSEQDVRGHFLVREALEVQAASLFAQIATPEEKAELLKLAIRVDAMASQTSSDRFVYLSVHERFHRRIAECTHFTPLCDAIDRTSALSSTWQCASREREPGVRRNHQILAEELMKTPEAAGEAMRAHIRQSMENTLRRLQPYFALAENPSPRFSRVARESRLESAGPLPVSEGAETEAAPQLNE
jgi:DNA-binding GntR family transcriptional regulator